MTSYGANINKLFYYWLVISFVLVFIMIVVGGLTRLTDSGLSITKWELFSGILPPLSDITWNNYFNQYKQIPQFKLLNPDMSLNEFKVIFYWEYFHRILGRIIGLFFIIPLVFFYFTNVINKKSKFTCLAISVLIIFQGVVGWYMVKSGLTNDTTVSHYRLSIHLTTAVLIISLIFWMIINIKENVPKNFFINKINNYPFYLLLLLMFLQIIIGAFVSGLDAGKIYQTWPLMNLTYFPDDVTINKFFNFLNFDNSSLVQFYHRNLAYLITIYIFILGFNIYKKRKYIALKPFIILTFFLLLQILLGIFTLISGLNIYLASAHQISSLLLMLSTINLCHKYIK